MPAALKLKDVAESLDLLKYTPEFSGSVSLVGAKNLLF